MVKTTIKKVLSIFAIVGLSFTGSVAASAEEQDQQVVAIIDAGFDAERFGDSVILEACILAYSFGCNDISEGFETGPGAAGATSEVLPRYQEKWNHGNLMAQAVLDANPNAKLILIKNAKVFGGRMLNATHNDFKASMKWIAENADEYGIDAVSYSMGSHRYVAQGGGSVDRYQRMVDTYQRFIDRYQSMGMPESSYGWLINLKEKYEAKIANAGTVKCPTMPVTTSSIESLAAQGIPTFIAAGNNADKDYISRPACIDAAVAVSSADSNGNLLRASNFSSTKTDFVVPAPDTSTATAKLAGAWVANPSISESGTPVGDSNALLVLNN